MLGGWQLARTARISVMVQKEMKDRLQLMSKGMGMTESALAAYIIGQWMFTQQQINGKVFEALSAPQLQSLIQTVMDGSGSEGAERT